MKSADGYDVVDAGRTQRLVGFVRQHATLAGDQRRNKGSLLLALKALATSASMMRRVNALR